MTATSSLPIPVGWYQVAYADEVAAGQVVPLRSFGVDLIAYRGDGGRVTVMDAHCPHLGAHIGYGGFVDGDAVVCPFHEWRFDCTGQNVRVPYRDNVNRGARLRPWATRELGPAILCWYGPPGHEEPTWEPPSLPELSRDDLMWYTPEEARYRFSSHPVEIMENTVDIAHFQYVHGVSGFGAVEIVEKGVMFRADASVTMQTGRGEVDGSIESELWGLGLDVVRPHGLVDGVVLWTVTPVEPGIVDARYSFLLPHVDGELTNGARKMAAEFQRQANQDIPIWEHKVHHDQPRLASGEGAIMDFRRWADQFYPGVAEARA
ncbi:Rieske 2Fe-2S domain-containing protein [Euzebya sp.]|uniref:Rieske 2Fe-2S domain-containing protein n=1 Tax=Euzebya sp. TaxID=1971409 RepID=UPI00351943C1